MCVNRYLQEWACHTHPLAEFTMYRLILVPLDGSRFGESALPLALRLSHLTGARIHLVTVQEIL
ncbi:MAG: universal stress protein, partial [Longimicrobiales bacterium]|nr:universal stress protein [Longimicrobiales bacterium]